MTYWMCLLGFHIGHVSCGMRHASCQHSPNSWVSITTCNQQALGTEGTIFGHVHVPTQCFHASPRHRCSRYFAAISEMFAHKVHIHEIYLNSKKKQDRLVAIISDVFSCNSRSEFQDVWECHSNLQRHSGFCDAARILKHIIIRIDDNAETGPP